MRLDRSTIIRLVALMVLIGTVTSVFMLQFDWNGEAASRERHEIDRLLDVMILISSYVFAVVMVLAFYAVYKYRAKPGDESDGEPIHGNTKLEIAWTVIPTIIVLFGGVYSWIVLDDIEAKSADGPTMKVNITAQQWTWRFDYVDEGKTSTELHVPAGTQLQIKLSALDVLHSFWVPEWGIKRDAVPQGQGNEEVDDEFVVTPDKEGTYSVVCAELCGTGHSVMKAPAVAESQEDFDAWLADQNDLPDKGDNGGAGVSGGNFDKSTLNQDN